jgi:hypothetical protein
VQNIINVVAIKRYVGARGGAMIRAPRYKPASNRNDYQEYFLGVKVAGT